MLYLLLCFVVSGTPLSQEMVYNFEKRRNELLNGNAMLMAMFLDPRHLFELTATERSDIKQKLIALFKRIESTYLPNCRNT